MNIRGKIEDAPIIFENQFPLVSQYFSWRDAPIIIQAFPKKINLSFGIFQIQIGKSIIIQVFPKKSICPSVIWFFPNTDKNIIFIIIIQASNNKN